MRARIDPYHDRGYSLGVTGDPVDHMFGMIIAYVLEFCIEIYTSAVRLLRHEAALFRENHAFGLQSYRS
jgi:hypothetical protein